MRIVPVECDVLAAGGGFAAVRGLTASPQPDFDRVAPSSAPFPSRMQF